MSDRLNSAELLESIDRHFMAGCGFIDAAQLRQHAKAGACPECSVRARLAAERENVTAGE